MGSVSFFIENQTFVIMFDMSNAEACDEPLESNTYDARWWAN